MRRLAVTTTVVALLVAGTRLQGSVTAEGNAGQVPVTSVSTVGMTVSDMDRSVEFYTTVLDFRKVSDVEVSGRDYELLTGVFGARLRIVMLQLGDESIELTEYIAPKGRPFPPDVKANDMLFQHIAIIVSDMDRAYARLRQFNVEHASTGPQRLRPASDEASRRERELRHRAGALEWRIRGSASDYRTSSGWRTRSRTARIPGASRRSSGSARSPFERHRTLADDDGV